MSEASGPNHRLKSYKNKALDTQELRRRREEEGIQLRKQKRDEHVRWLKLFMFIYEHSASDIFYNVWL